jgi:hypothetical protein
MSNEKITLFIKNGTLTIVALLLIFFLVEIVFRALGYKTALPVDNTKPSVTGYFWISDENLGFKNRPSGKYFNEAIFPIPYITTDQNGFRNGFQWSPDTQRPIILFIGDSTVFCAEVNDEDTIPSVVAQYLRPEFNISCLNAGVRGYNTLQSKRLMIETLDIYKNIKMVVYCFCQNDFIENINPDSYFPAKAPVILYNKKTSEFKEVEVNEPTVPFGKSFNEKLTEHRTAWLEQKRIDQRIRDTLFEYSAASYHIQARVSLAARIFRNRKNKELVPGTEKIKLASSVFTHLIKEMHNICMERGIQFIVTNYPTTPDWMPFEEIVHSSGVKFLNMSPHFKNKPDKEWHPKRRNGLYDPHFSEKGAELFGMIVADTIRQELLR